MIKPNSNKKKRQKSGETFFDVVHYQFWMMIGSIAEQLFVRMK